MFRIVMVDGWYRAVICTDNKPSKYGKPKDFKTLKEAKKWVKENSYWGMSFRYEIIKETNENDKFSFDIKEKSPFVAAGGKLEKAGE